MKAVVQSVLERALLAFGILLYRLKLHRVVIMLGSRRLRVLGYHACEELENEWITGLRANVRPAVLAMHMEFLRQHYNFVTLDQVEQGHLPSRAVLVTFDDGYRSVYLNAFPLLAALRIPAIVHVVSSAVDNRAFVWVDELNWHLRRHGSVALLRAAQVFSLPPSADADEVLAAACAHYEPRRIAELLAAIRSEVGGDVNADAARANLYLTWDDIREMARQGIVFGNHTATHPNLSQLGELEQRQEMAACREALVTRGLSCTSFALPFGVAGRGSAQIAVSLGHSAVFEGGGGNERCLLPGVGRLFSQAAKEGEFFAELEIVAPVLSWLRRLRAVWRGTLQSVPTRAAAT